MEIIEIDFKSGNHDKYPAHVIASFLEEHLQEYGDKKEDIMACIAYAMLPEKGGFILLAIAENEIVGATIVNFTGMSGYIPSNILVYIAVHSNQRGKGIGKILMETAINRTKGGIALHVEPNNPARNLYEKLGFTNKYLEMRFSN